MLAVSTPRTSTTGNHQGIVFVRGVLTASGAPMARLEWAVLAGPAAA